MYRNAADFYILILHPATSLTSFTSLNSIFLWNLWGFVYIMLFINSNSFIFPLPIWILLFLFLLWLLWQRLPKKLKLKVLVTQACLTVYDPTDWSPPGSSVHGISQARKLKWVAISFSRGSFQPRDQSYVSCIAGRFFAVWASREAPKASNTILNRSESVILCLIPNLRGNTSACHRWVRS